MSGQMSIDQGLKGNEYKAKIVENMLDPTVIEFILDTGSTLRVKHCGSFIQVRLNCSTGEELAVIGAGGSFDIGPSFHFVSLAYKNQTNE